MREILLVAEQLWSRVLAVSRADRDAIRAIQRIAQRQVQPVNSISEILSITQPVASPGGDRAVALEPTSIRKDERPVFEFEVVTVNAQGKEIKREQRQAEYITEDLGNGVSLEMVSIPGGKFMMGSPKDEAQRQEWESPQHEVTVPPFFMGKYPVTQAQWRVVATLPQINRELKPDPSNFKGGIAFPSLIRYTQMLFNKVSSFDNVPHQVGNRYKRPVEQVSWYDAVEFCDRLAAHTKRRYRLPSEAEWEYACRAGTTSPFHFGETITTDLANYRGTDNEKYKWSASYGRRRKGIYREETTPVGSFEVANAFGLYDMHGNVLEWCLDDWHDNYEEAPTDGSPWFDENYNFYQKQGRTVLRGGSWIFNPEQCRSAYRFYCDCDYLSYYFGFRIVCGVGRFLQ